MKEITIKVYGLRECQDLEAWLKRQGYIKVNDCYWFIDYKKGDEKVTIENME